MKKRWISLLLVFAIVATMVPSAIATTSQTQDSTIYPTYPDSERPYWIIFREGYRNGRVELSVFNITDSTDGLYIVWNRNLKLSDHSKFEKCNQYYIGDNNEWVKFVTGYSVMSDYATEIIASNLDVYDRSGNLVCAKSSYPGEYTAGSETNWDNYIDLNTDVNYFPHYSMRYQISNADYIQALWDDNLNGALLEWFNIFDINEQLNSTEAAGYCHGLAVSICLGSKGDIDFHALPSWCADSGYNYYSLLAPYAKVPNTENNNDLFRDLLIYYQLTQHTLQGDWTKKVTNSGLAKEWRLESFLESLVNEAKRSEKEESPFVFSYCYYTLDADGNKGDISGHSVVVCGYNWNDATKQHAIQIYDENCASRGAEYYVLSVAEDYASFSFIDANSRGYRDKGYKTYKLEDKWVELRYYGIDTIHSDLTVVDVPVQTNAADDAETIVTVSANAEFTIKNSEGQYITYTDGEFRNTMKVLDLMLTGSEDNPYWAITVPTSSTYTLLDASDECTVILTIDGNEYAVCCNGASSVTFDGSSVVVEGEHVDYDISMVPAFSNTSFVTMKGTSFGNTSFSYNDNQQNIQICSEVEMEDVEVLEYTKFAPEYVHIPDSDTYEVIESTEEDGAAVVVEDVEMQMAPKINPFTDVPAGSFYEAPVLWALESGITTGATADTFNPGGQCLRAHVVTFLHRAAENPEPSSTNNPFTDVKATDFFYKPVLWAVENGITNGVSADKFGSYDVCNRAAVVTFLWRSAGCPEPESAYNPFVDVKPSDFFYKAVLWAVENGITNGLTATEFGPNSPCNRAQVVTFLYRSYN